MYGRAAGEAELDSCPCLWSADGIRAGMPITSWPTDFGRRLRLTMKRSTAVPVERSMSTVVTAIGVVTLLWGGAHMAMGVCLHFPGDGGMAPAPGFSPVHWIVACRVFDHAGIFFVLQGILGLLAGFGVLLRLQWGRILTFILATLAILWGLASVEAYRQQDDIYYWKSGLIAFGAVQLLYAILAFVILIKNGAAFAEPGDSDQSKRSRPIYVWAAWASPSVAAVISVVLWLWIENHQGVAGQRAPAVVLFYVLLLLASAAAGLAAVIGLVGIRSKRNALNIIPGALLGICINSANAFFCVLAYAFEGTRW
jgi:hypothetical protein